MTSNIRQFAQRDDPNPNPHEFQLLRELMYEGKPRLGCSPPKEVLVGRDRRRRSALPPRTSDGIWFIYMNRMKL